MKATQINGLEPTKKGRKDLENEEDRVIQVVFYIERKYRDRLKALVDPIIKKLKKSK